MRLDEVEGQESRNHIKKSHMNEDESAKSIWKLAGWPHFPRRQRWQLLPEGREEWSFYLAFHHPRLFSS